MDGSRLTALEDYTRGAGAHYGTEDFAVFLYALAKMQRPQRVLELGTGLGVTTFWLARALQENGDGAILTVDDGSHWASLSTQPAVQAFNGDGLAYQAFLEHMAVRFGVAKLIRFLNTSVPPFPSVERELDLLFSDYRHDANGVSTLLQHYLPMMADVSSIFIDSASTYHHSYLLLERLVELFNRGVVPHEFVRGLSADKAAALHAKVVNKRFTLVHLTEVKDRDQNSTAWLKIEPLDILPHPATRMR